ncbi:telomerase reverse transcriptase [Purpureocillium lilacinum]|uniref:Telomerase reverse transcriptase n=1 Tax=Purpureocillium lilacinum TaxID=33203 RepID=A0A179HQC8_PURLI|nr:telomerase reverse transcriptase [Purpureocillium lilacinum]OAQ91878.1 telomerase reverse transcriptase [Purpureocillium lilacinum]
MVNLLVGCSVFVSVEAGLGNYYQLSGTALSAQLELLRPASASATVAQTKGRRASDIIFVRSRIFYAKPAITAHGRVHIGFKHIRSYVLNRCRYAQLLSRRGDSLSPADVEQAKHNDAKTIKVMMYMFPRQFGLHNVFTSGTNRQETAQRFQDYTLRENEIARLLEKHPSLQRGPHPKIPKRLRGAPLGLVQRLQVLHHRCSYTELLRHYCPTFLDGRRRSRGCSSQLGATNQGTARPPPSAERLISQVGRRPKRRVRNVQPNTQVSLPSSITSFVELASPVSQVSAFCQAALSKLIPSGFWGEGDTMYHNKTAFLRSVDRFIKLRRFEAMTLHDVAQGLRVSHHTT